MTDVKANGGTLLRARPLSPHLSVYRWTLTMAMSIAHRLTGAALYAGTLLLVWWLVALATDAGAYESFARFIGSIPGRIVLFGFTWALFHHMFGGIRHFVWDVGRGLDHPARERITALSLVAGLALTLLVWIIAFLVR
ncbi:MAG: succinate dehydrogenase, cytochrome b556 subunit [Methylobacteriaceae bacterium]|nr:succinate dehydrogenase, cytochrome b556 subunit [Methylobacteriaceae bacterium]MBV9245081.1 succinate dehydrogenase, cytochrome b556 subunit [Methylobacteriaceae bacterium]MBV9637647.1 succinate dehydrogenase, cytochrome b556 subunit [Methylobacteriaceae bacterium]MBV9703044.1 succinate dehydrogenase, cytochrome b556 subunit [Methylobacteriaceae bacterium]